jgi:hypothetical protein
MARQYTSESRYDLTARKGRVIEREATTPPVATPVHQLIDRGRVLVSPGHEASATTTETGSGCC